MTKKIFQPLTQHVLDILLIVVMHILYYNCEFTKSIPINNIISIIQWLY